MKYTLLELTQNILSSMDSDEVNSIDDTAEARQVAQVIRTTYFNILARADLPELTGLVQLDPSGDADQPVLMLRPDNVLRIDWIKYNIRDVDDTDDNFAYVTILPTEQFLHYVNALNDDETYVNTMTLNDFTFKYRNDSHPRYCTVLNDYYFVFDAYDADVDTTLQASKTMCMAKTTPAFSLTDTFVPELDDRQFPLLLNEAKSLAFYELKQMPHEKAELEAKRQWKTLQRTKKLDKPNWFDQLPNFARK